MRNLVVLVACCAVALTVGKIGEGRATERDARYADGHSRPRALLHNPVDQLLYVALSTRDEVAACREFVERQIGSIRPRVICALGSTAAETILETRESMGRLRGRWYEFQGLPVMVTYHPAYLLRDPSRKADTWADLKQILAHLNPSSSVSAGG